MSTRYPGGIITKNYVAPTPSSASGIWTLDQQEQAQQAGIWPFGGPFNYIEDVFSTWLYTGNGTSQTITNGIDLSGKGGFVWIKSRSNTENQAAFDTSRGVNKYLLVNTDFAELNYSGFGITAFNSNGFSVAGGGGYAVNTSAYTYASWTFREQAKFFDVVTWTGNATNRTIAHALGSIPGCIIVKRIDADANWQVYHRSLANTEYLVLNSDAAKATGTTRWNSTTPTSTVFSLGTDATVNASGGTYVAYIFAHDAGGFGLTGSDNVISCGSFTVSAGGTASVTLGYEPQWVLFKASSRVLNWSIHDTMRGMPVGSVASGLYPNLADAESNNVDTSPTATGFTWSGYANETFVYVAIRRGPMKVPTDATKVFDPEIYTGNDVDGRLISSGFPVDTAIIDPRNGYATPGGPNWFSRLTGNGYFLQTASTNAESNGSSNSNGIMGQDGITVARTGTNVWSNVASNTYVSWFMRRAPSFFDVVCYTGTGVARTVTHNLGVAPELMIVKSRSAATYGEVYAAPVGNTKYMYTAFDQAASTGTSSWNNTSPTSTNFTVGVDSFVNANGATFVAWLFATCPGVSKVGSYTGTGATQTIDCGFTGGARFVLVKRTDLAGDWYVWDTARGMVAGTDPSLLLNTTAAEVNANSVYTIATGFQIVSTAAGINASGGAYIFLAIA